MGQRNVTIQSVQVYPAAGFRVVAGANQGDPVGLGDEVMRDDVYMLDSGLRKLRLGLQPGANGAFRVDADTAVGTPGAAVHLDCVLTFMSPDGHTQEALILVELDAQGDVAASYLLPLAEIEPRTDYTLVGIDASGAPAAFARVACVYFARGTHITLSTGEQRRVEDLRVGDRVLTRDGGAQPIRWIGSSTVRATGAMAPIVIEAGALNNEHDLMVSPDHRLFVYQREDRIGAGQPELMVRARHLVNGDTVRVAEGGFVDYFQLLFDSHHIIYAEGIAAESMLVDPRTRPSLPPELIERLEQILPGHDRAGMHGMDVQKALLDRPDAIDLLRRASTR